LVDEVAELSRNLPDDAKAHDALYFADKVKDAEGALLRAQQEFTDDADIIQVEARLRHELDQEDRALKALWGWPGLWELRTRTIGEATSNWKMHWSRPGLRPAGPIGNTMPWIQKIVSSHQISNDAGMKGFFTPPLTG